MEKINIRLTENTLNWIKQRAEIEKVTISAMIRMLLEREQFRDEIEKQFDKKKRGNK